MTKIVRLKMARERQNIMENGAIVQKNDGDQETTISWKLLHITRSENNAWATIRYFMLVSVFQ